MAVEITKETAAGILDDNADIDAVNKQLAINEKNAASILQWFMASRNAQILKETK